MLIIREYIHGAFNIIILLKVDIYCRPHEMKFRREYISDIRNIVENERNCCQK